jgi:hypothetical protein
MVTHVHRRIPHSVLKVYDQGHGPGLEPEDLAAYFGWEEEALRYAVDLDIFRDELVRLIECSTIKIA